MSSASELTNRFTGVTSGCIVKVLPSAYVDISCRFPSLAAQIKVLRASPQRKAKLLRTTLEMICVSDYLSRIKGRGSCADSFSHLPGLLFLVFLALGPFNGDVGVGPFYVIRLNSTESMSFAEKSLTCWIGSSSSSIRILSRFCAARSLLKASRLTHRWALNKPGACR